MKLNTVTEFVACREAMSEGELALVSYTDGSNSSVRMDRMCPRHQSTACLETYLARQQVSRWSLARFLRWRRDALERMK
ncbi:hypothetical protein [Micromonospora sp. NPDC005652]|uniref:hypothetical protein n=1 Tax=Micromonospora sp. NPDC005652 TaxID=3157046 RepID=UPI0033F1FEAA